jgi:aldehyde dehydrogenase (NAD+)
MRYESIAKELVKECKKAIVELYGTDPDPKTRSEDYSRTISSKAVERLAGLIGQKKVRLRSKESGE